MAQPVLESMHPMKEYASRLFYDHFHARCDLVAASPGRVNLIGEHTDYNSGFVLPMALDKEVYVAAKRRSDKRIRAYSPETHQSFEMSLTDIRPDPTVKWSPYVAGIYWALTKDGYHVLGADLLIVGNLPQGVGLSSSAALELALARAACALGGWAWDAAAMALVGQTAESDFVGVKCGIMDQFAVAVSEPQSALFLDCKTLGHRSIPVQFDDAIFVVTDTGVQRELTSSAYNERREQCEKAVTHLIPRRTHASSLRDVDLSALKKFEGSAEKWVRRARHVISENARVLEAVQALESRDAARFGALMTASHESLRDDYEVSCRELDLLVAAALRFQGTLGSRLTGAGFGGCTVSLVRSDRLEEFVRQVPQFYRASSGREAQVHVFQPGKPARIL